jgi:hypothetical protein
MIFDRFSRTKTMQKRGLVRGFCKMDCGYRAGRTKMQRVTTGRICWVAEPKEIKLVRGEAFQRQGRPYCALASLIWLRWLANGQRHADRARAESRASKLTTPQETERTPAVCRSIDAIGQEYLSQGWRHAEVVLGQTSFGVGCQLHLVYISRADGAGAVRRDCCGDCEADAYTMTAGDRKRSLNRHTGLEQLGSVHVLLLRSIDG